MAVVFFQRFRMRIDLREVSWDNEEAPPDFELCKWNRNLLAAHGEVKYRSFRNEIDANVFPCLGQADGCLKLMREISCRRDFVPEATWLVTHTDPATGRKENCGTVQGIRESLEVGSIQNVGIVNSHRGKGLGSLIVRKSLQGFQETGTDWVTLEVTAKNLGAIRLYERLGFRIVRTVFKSAEIGEV